MAEPALQFYQEPFREEMHNGQIVAMAGHTANHGEVSGNIFSIFKRILKGRKCRVVQDGLKLYLSDKDRFFPDVMIVCNPDIYKTEGVFGTPDLIVEILSPSTARYDRGCKKNTYEKHGVKEYWLVDTNTPSIEVYLLKDGKYELDDTYILIDDRHVPDLVDEAVRDNMPKEFATSIYPDLMISVEEIFEGLI